MKTKFALALLSTLGALCYGQAGSGNKNELALGLAAISPSTRSDVPSLQAGAGMAFQVNYGRRLFASRRVALLGEINFLASPLRHVSSSVPMATHDFASLYITPGLRLKFTLGSRVSPYAVIGGGYGDYEQSRTTLDGQPNTSPRELGRGVLDFGAGVDFRVWKFVSLRGESRDYYTGSPSYNLAEISGGQHNVITSASFVLGWH